MSQIEQKLDVDELVLRFDAVNGQTAIERDMVIALVQMAIRARDPTGDDGRVLVCALNQIRSYLTRKDGSGDAQYLENKSVTIIDVVSSNYASNLSVVTSLLRQENF